MEINDIVYHPCNMDIIQHKITGIRTYEDHVLYEAKAIHPVGASGRIEILLSEDKKGNIRFTGLIDDPEYGNGLGDFVEGLYYKDQQKARLVYNEAQRILVWSNMEEKRRSYENAKFMYDKVEKIINTIKEEIDDRE